MPPRVVQFHFFMTEAEAERFNQIVKRSGLSRSSYLRQLIAGVIPADRPPPDYYAMMRELHAIGNNLNQIARHAHATGSIDDPRYDRNIANLDAAIARITEATVLPRRRQ